MGTACEGEAVTPVALSSRATCVKINDPWLCDCRNRITTTSTASLKLISSAPPNTPRSMRSTGSVGPGRQELRRCRRVRRDSRHVRPHRHPRRSGDWRRHQGRSPRHLHRRTAGAVAIRAQPKFDIALDPIDGTTNFAKGLPNSISLHRAPRHPRKASRPCGMCPVFTARSSRMDPPW